MSEVTQQTQDGDSCVRIQSRRESDGDQQREEFRRRDLEDVEHGCCAQEREWVALRATHERLIHRWLQRGLDLEAPSFQQRLRDVLRVLVTACPLPQASRPEILVGGELVFAHNLFEFGDGGGDGPDRLRLTPIRISASLGHEKTAFPLKGMKLRNLSIYKILEIGLEIHRLAFMDVFAVGQT